MLHQPFALWKQDHRLMRLILESKEWHGPAKCQRCSRETHSVWRGILRSFKRWWPEWIATQKCNDTVPKSKLLDQFRVWWIGCASQNCCADSLLQSTKHCWWTPWDNIHEISLMNFIRDLFPQHGNEKLFVRRKEWHSTCAKLSKPFRSWWMMKHGVAKNSFHKRRIIHLEQLQTPIRELCFLEIDREMTKEKMPLILTLPIANEFQMSSTIVIPRVQPNP